MTSKIYLIPEDVFRQLIQSSHSYYEVLKKIRMSHGRSSSDIIKRRCNELNISCDHFTRQRKVNNGTAKYSLEEILIENSKYANTSRLKERIIKEKLLKYECSICHNKGEWMEQPLTLQLDHINGIHNDHRLENLRFLCPNCHTQTQTYGSKRGTKSD